MAVVYFDSSALVKLIVDEDGSEIAAELWDRCDAAVTSRLAYPEVCAALAGAGRSRRLDSEAQSRAAQLWEEFWAAVRVVELTTSVADRAGRLAAQHGLRGADAVHLASCLTLGTQTVFAVWDRRLRLGAHEANMVVAPQPTH